ncbi:MAG: NAD(+) synthase [Parcubacteria group bacterium]|nr:NAD(+) synthase [Parcubacteria group bacterium]
MKKSLYGNNFGFIRVAAAVPFVRVGDLRFNTREIIAAARRASAETAAVVVFPELSLTGYSLGDLFQHECVQMEALRAAQEIAEALRDKKIITVIGLPIPVGAALYNVAAVLYGGNIVGVVPKTYLPGYKEFYEERWFSSGVSLSQKTISIAGKEVPIGTDILFELSFDPRIVLGIEICEDAWVPIPPSARQALSGATIIANLSASNDLIGKAAYRKDLIKHHSASGISGYIYASAGVSESTTDVVYGGHAIIAENGTILSESERFRREGTIQYADIDIEHLVFDRKKTTSFEAARAHVRGPSFRRIAIDMPYGPLKNSKRRIDPRPFVPDENNNDDVRDVFAIQSHALAQRLSYAGLDNAVIGVSGGLDSALALLVAAEACAILRIPAACIHAISMPGPATSDRTKRNARILSDALGATFEEISIHDGVAVQIKDIAHDGKTQDVVFENVQARYRTMILMDKANQTRGIVVGTGDLSEIALGWNTFTGDHISHYNVNAGVPKTLIARVVSWACSQERFSATRSALQDILSTPVSPELTMNKKGALTQKTEDILGPYELHDFFLYHFVRWGSSPAKIAYLARNAFTGIYSAADIRLRLKIFLKRFFANQWKRSVMPDGPKVGSVSLSPRGDWRMPSDAHASFWVDGIRKPR